MLTRNFSQHQLSTMVTSKICAIQLNEDGSFFEGPFICADDVPEDIFKGPYSSVSEYLVNWAKVWREKMKDRIGIKPHAEGQKYPSLLRILEDFPTMLLSSIKNADQFLEYYGKGGNTLVHGIFHTTTIFTTTITIWSASSTSSTASQPLGPWPSLGRCLTWSQPLGPRSSLRRRCLRTALRK
jgi:hypothetical protein